MKLVRAEFDGLPTVKDVGDDVRRQESQPEQTGQAGSRQSFLFGQLGDRPIMFGEEAMADLMGSSEKSDETEIRPRRCHLARRFR